jgi:hypothetical protein
LRNWRGDDFVDLRKRPEKVEETAKIAAANAAHLARRLKPG